MLLVFGESNRASARVRPRVCTPEPETRGHTLPDIRRRIIILVNPPHITGCGGTTKLELHVRGQAAVELVFRVPKRMIDDLPIL